MATPNYAPIMDVLRKTFKSKITMDVEWRKKQLNQIIKLVIENDDAIMQAVTKDLGRPASEAFLGEVGATLDDVRFILDGLDEWVKPVNKPTPMMQKPASSQIHAQPKGVVLIISPWNFPVSLCLTPLAGAISAGCCAVIKPSEVSAHCAALLADLLPKYLDPKAFRCILGAVPETTALLNLRWDHIMYTGNGTVGKIVMKAASKFLTPVTLELGGKSPVFIDENVNVDVACRRLLSGKFFNNGQICIAPDYLLLHKNAADKFIAGLKKTVVTFFGENPQKSDSLARMVNVRHFNRVKDLVDSADGEIIYGGTAGCNESDLYLPPTFILNPSFDSKIMQNEIFGPVLPIMVVDSMDTAIDIVNDREKPLALYVFSSDKKTVDKIVSNTSSGGCCVNDTIFHISNPHLPFGGVGPSGMGAYHGKASFDTFSHFRSVMYRATWMDPGARYPPYNDKNLNTLKKVIIGPLVPLAVKRLVLGSLIAATAGAGVYVGSRL